METVKIGNQEWSTLNLNVDRFNNGDLIPEVKTGEEWQKYSIKKQPAWCFYDNNPEYGDKFGRLYNWHAVIDPRGIIPDGWHIPSSQEFELLVIFLGGQLNFDEKANFDASKKLKSTTEWITKKWIGNNKSGFNGLPAGLRNYAGCDMKLGLFGVWWSKTDDGQEWAWKMELNSGQKYNGFSLIQKSSTASGYSIRYLRNI
jgi:uncharacterized protein (TIGR02145 family)